MPACKACGEWFAKTRDDRVLCSKCEMALGRLAGYAVVVTRCKNCKFSHADEHGCTCEGYWFELSEYAVPVKGDAFCSYGKPKEDLSST